MATNTILEGASGGRDENKVSTASVSYYAKSIEEVTTIGEGNYHGLVEQGRSWQSINDGTDGWVVTISYKGYMDADSTKEDPQSTEQWSLDYDFSEDPLESHPDIQTIIETYGGYYEEQGGPLLFKNGCYRPQAGGSRKCIQKPTNNEHQRTQSAQGGKRCAMLGNA